MFKFKKKFVGVSISVLLVVAIGGLVSLVAGAVLFMSGYANFKNTTELVLDNAQSVSPGACFVADATT